MVIIKLQGGLGNQMFQYAAARSIAKKAAQVYLDHSFLETNSVSSANFTARGYELSIFDQLRAVKASNFQLGLFKGNSLVLKLLRKLIDIRSFQEDQFNKEVPTQYLNAKHLYLDGYFQSEKYFSSIRKDLLKDFKFPDLDAVNKGHKEIIQRASNAVALHIRRGDYVKSTTVYNTHGIMPLSYYAEAIGILKEKYSAITLFVFADDKSWAQSNLKLTDNAIYFIDSNADENSWKDMALMTYCKHHIIANSTFSWWGAWLSQENNKTVIAPKQWFKDKHLNKIAIDLVPQSWILI